MQPRHLDIAVISDVHLGTYGCHAKELCTYLRSISPKTLILNGDIIDFWQAKKKYFPVEHIQVINQILGLAQQGTTVYYITGNHDDVLRRLSEFSLGNIHLRDKLILHINNKKHWIFHGDVFDTSVTVSPFLAKLGGKSYDFLIRLNRMINRFLERSGKERLSFSKAIKSGVKRAVKFVNDFEQIAIDHAISQSYDYVICGHIHTPQMKNISTNKGSVTYLNSGDWVENLTSLEYLNGSWKLYTYDENAFIDMPHDMDSLSNKTDFEPKSALTVDDIQKQLNL